MLTADQVVEIRRLRSRGWLQRDLALAFGCTRSNIGAVVTGKTWRHLL